MKNSVLCFLFLIFASSQLSAQITGRVTDDENLPLPGVAISAQQSGSATVTDLDGNFTIAAMPGEIITFSYIGFRTESIPATASPMNVSLVTEQNRLEEVVVIGYGTRKLGSITGSISQVKADEIVRTPAQSPIQSIQGKAAGVNIVTNDEPGANPTIRIRGLGTLLGGRDPLYIIDGVESYGLNGLSPNEIATIDILKDASSLAIYGQKGSNGVVIISTKKGRAGELKVSYDSYYGHKFIQRKVDMADSYRFAYYNNTAAGSASYFNFEQPNNTDWLKEITTTGEVMNNYISVAGASDNANYYFGATNYREKGILIGTEFDRTNVNNRNEFRLFGNKVKINNNINLAVTNTTPRPLSAFTNAYKQSPIVPVRFANGRWGVPLRNPDTGLIDINGSDRFNNVGNPVAQLALTNERSKNINLTGSVGIDIKIFQDLRFTSNFGGTYENYKGFSLAPNAEVWLSQNATQQLEDYEDSFGSNEVIYNTLRQWRGDNYNWNWDNYFTYQKSFGKHDITAVAGMSRTTRGQSSFLSGTRFNVPESSNYWSLNLSSYNSETAPGAVTSGSISTPLISIGYFGRVEYEYNNRYLLSAVIRREGISGFQSDKQWGVFPAVSAGWIISNEDFLSGSSFVNFLKIRGGYGELGNGNVVNATNNVIFGSGYNYAFGPDQTIFPGSVQPYQVDPNLTWETMREIDLGIDFGFLDNKLSGTFDVYDRKSTNLIVPISVPRVLSPQNVTVNSGEVTNKGFEAALRWEDNLTDNFKYWLGGNFSFNENELTKVDNSYFSDFIGGGLANGQFTKQVVVGHPLGSFYVYEVTGIDSDGQFTYSEERSVVGSYLPKYTYGFNIGFNYKNFDFSADAYGVGGNKLYNGKKAQRFGGENIEFDYLDDFWTPSTPNATNPAPNNAVPIASDYYIEDGDYLRINNLTLGYTLPEVNKNITRLRVYVTAINPFVFTKFTGFSPEISGGDGNPLGNAGIELDAYPTNKTFLLGINVSF